MSPQRMGSTRPSRQLSRKTWITGALAVSAVAVTGGVAMASEHEGDREKASNEHGTKLVAAPVTTAPTPSGPAAGGSLCLQLNKSDLKAFEKAEKRARHARNFVVKLRTDKLVPCPSDSTGPAPTQSAPAPSTTSAAPAPSTTSPAPAPSTTSPAPAPSTTTPKPSTTAPKPSTTTTTPKVTSTAS